MKNTRQTKNILATSAAALLALCAVPTASHAAAKQWTDGAVDGLWSSGGNWNGGTIPAAAGDDLEFSNLGAFLGTRTATNGPLTPVTTANSILFAGPTQKFILNGTAITLTTGLTNNSGVGGVGQTISFGGTGVTLGTNQTWAANTSNLLVTSNVALNAKQLVITGAGVTTITGTISGAGQPGFGAILIGNAAVAGNLTLTPAVANTYTAGAGGVGTQLANGILTVNLTGALSTGTLLIGNGGVGTRTLASGVAGVTIGNAITVRDNFSVAPTSTLTISGTVTLDAAVSPTTTITQSNGAVAGPVLNVSGVIAQSGGAANLVLAGANSHFIFSGAAANTYAGTTTLNEGLLELNKTSGTDAIAGNLFVGDGTGAANSAEVRLLQSSLINNVSAVTVQSDGNFNMNGFGDTVTNVTINSGHVSGLPTAGGALFVQNVLTMTGGTIDGAGGALLLKAGGGLSVTAVSDALGNAATINSNVDLNAATQTFTVNAGSGAVDLNLTGVISNGGVTKLGGGVLQYSGSGTNTYTGLTTVSAGTLLLNNNGTDVAVGTGGLLINGTGTVRLAQSSEIDNTATVTVDAGTFDLNGHFEDIGTLAGVGGQVTSGVGGTLQILAGSTTYAGNIVGAGSFQVTGGTQTLSGVNTYTGPTTVNGATLKAASNTALSPNSNFSLGAGGVLDLNGRANTIGALNSGAVATGLVTNTAAAAASLTVGNTNTNGNFGGIIVNGAGTVSLVKVGSATQILTGINTYTGNTTIGGGALQVDGRIASANTFVNALGTLTGVGVIGGNVVNGGTVSPGHSVATLTVKGNYTQTSAGALRVEFAGQGAGQHDVLAVGGAAALDGTVRLVNLGSVRLKRGQSVTFLTAGGGVSGKFSTVNSDSFLPSGRLLRAGVVYHASTVDLAAIQGSFANDLGSLTPNQKAVAHNLDNVVNDSRANKIIDYLDQESLGSLRGDLDKIAPEELAAIFNIGVSLANVQTANLERRMGDLHDGSTGFSSSGYGVGGNSQSYGGTTQTYSGDASYNSGHTSYRGPTGDGGKEMRAPIDNRVGVFVTGVGEFTNIGNTANARGYDLTTGGLTIGVDYKVTEHFVIGLNTGYARSSADLIGNGRVTVDGAKLGLYATYFTGTGFYVDAAANGGYNSYDTRRSALKGTASGGTNGLEFNGLLATGFDWKTPDGLTIGPVASVQYTNVQMNSFKEHGSLAPLKFNDQSGESLRTALGVKMSYDFHPVASGVVIRPEVRASWQHEFADSSYALTSRFANGAGNTFTVHGPQIGDDSLLVGAGVAVLWNERTSTYVYYDGEVFRSNYNSNNVSGGVRLTF